MENLKDNLTDNLQFVAEIKFLIKQERKDADVTQNEIKRKSI